MVKSGMEATKNLMKKVFAMLLLAMASVAANAQLYLGGTLGIGVENASYDGESATSTAFAIDPEVGYNFNDTWAVGATIGVQYQNVSEIDVTTVTVLPYVRGTFARAGIFDFFGEVALGYGHQSVEGHGASGFVAGLRPGFVAHFNDKFGLVGKTMLLKYNHFDGVNNVGFAINNGFEIGIQFTL